MLVTSRATLHLYGEHEFPVPPLALPDPKRLATLEKDPAASLTDYAAIELFRQRARAAKPDFALTATNASDVAQICIALDGLPLAIELASARIKLFSPSALLARLNERLTLLTGEHTICRRASVRCVTRLPGATTCSPQPNRRSFASWPSLSAALPSKPHRP